MGDLLRGCSPTLLAKFEASRDRMVAMVATSRRCKPGSAKGEDQACGRHGPGKRRRMPGLVSGLPSRGDRVINAALGLQLRDARALRHDLGEIGAIRTIERTLSDRPGNNPGHLCTTFIPPRPRTGGDRRIHSPGGGAPRVPERGRELPLSGAPSCPSPHPADYWCWSLRKRQYRRVPPRRLSLRCPQRTRIRPLRAVPLPPTQARHAIRPGIQLHDQFHVTGSASDLRHSRQPNRQQSAGRSPRTRRSRQ
jgi:hypothetical protein